MSEMFHIFIKINMLLRKRAFKNVCFTLMAGEVEMFMYNELLAETSGYN